MPPQDTLPARRGALAGRVRSLPRSRALVAVGLLLSVLLLAGGMILARLPGPGTMPGAGGTPGAAQAGTETGAEAGPEPGQVPGGTPPAATAPSAPRTLPPAAEPDPDRPLEVPPGAAGLSAGSLPASREVPERRTLLSLPLPPADAGDGRLVDAFPRDLVPPAPASSVLSSSIASSGNTLQAGLRGTGDPAAVLEFYDGHFAALGFLPGARETAGGTTTAVWSYGNSSVTVSAGSAVPGTGPGHTGYTVFAVLRASQ